MRDVVRWCGDIAERCECNTWRAIRRLGEYYYDQSAAVKVQRSIVEKAAEQWATQRAKLAESREHWRTGFYEIFPGSMEWPYV